MTDKEALDIVNDLYTELTNDRMYSDQQCEALDIILMYATNSIKNTEETKS